VYQEAPGFRHGPGVVTHTQVRGDPAVQLSHSTEHPPATSCPPHPVQIDPLDPVILVISMKMSAVTMGKYTREEFVGGMRKMGADSIDKLKQAGRHTTSLLITTLQMVCYWVLAGCHTRSCLSQPKRWYAMPVSDIF